MPPPNSQFHPVGCRDCIELLRQIATTRLDERRLAIAKVLNLRAIPPKDEWDLVANKTLELCAQQLAEWK